ncbi:unnamed protein product [marine sediment metagenome]|uniref:Uncharacterized protein n=1 Tax=marine sediment metagenome TaxID=412755 RepID=X1GPX7_9ZZZZ
MAERKKHCLFDVHTVKFFCGILSPNQVIAAFDIVATRAKLLLGYLPEYRMNIVYDKKSNSMGWGYIYTIHPEFYYLLIGKNKTGEQLYIESPFVIKENITCSNKDAVILLCGEYKNAKILCRPTNITPTKPIKLLDTEKLVEYNTVQKVTILQKYGKVEEHGSLVFEPAIAKTVPTGHYSNILVSGTALPGWLSFEQLYTIFEYYNNSKKQVDAPIYQRRGCRYIEMAVQKRSYPIIRLSSTNKIVVEYDPELNDGMFALLMSIKIYDPNNSASRWIIFRYADKLSIE